MLSKNLITAAAGAAGAGGVLGIEDTFSTWLYTGNGSTQTITNGIDLAGEGGLVWIKTRSGDFSGSHQLSDTARGANWVLFTNATNAQFDRPTGCTGFASTGFTLGTELTHNGTGTNYASWTFRKAEKFFDVVTYTGNGSNRTIAHNLGSVPGCIIVKRTDTTGNWQVYHRSLANTEYMVLNSTAAKATGTTRWNSTTPTSTVFSLGTDATVNASGGTYVAYLFAHDAGGFGDDGNQSVIKCGSYTNNASAPVVVNLGWEPQWILVKSSSSSANWAIVDNMRGIDSGRTAVLNPDTVNAEDVLGQCVTPTATGFEVKNNVTTTLNSAATTGTVAYIYIAIRRGPMKTPTDATKVFATVRQTGGGVVSTGFPVDMLISTPPAIATEKQFISRLTGGTRKLTSTSTAAEDIVGGSGFLLDRNTSISDAAWSSSNQVLYEAFRRAPGFLDVVAYTGTSAVRTVSHNLGVAPELMIIKQRSAIRNWIVYSAGVSAPTTSILRLNTTGAVITGVTTHWNSTAPTSTVFTVGNDTDVNASAGTYIAYLFASCPGVSKVGSYTGTGTTLDINCGFTAGARFVLIKRTDSTGDWYVWDTARGIISGNDPYLLLNSTAAEVTSTDYIDPLSSGFQISSTAPAAINANGGSFIYLAVA
jgi:hypothetical protein